MVRLILALLMAIFFAPSSSVGEEPPRRAKPPLWSQDVLDAFFEDARVELVGKRPQTGSSAATPNTALAIPGGPSPGNIHCSDLVEADTLTVEIKRLNITLTAALAKPAVFKGGGNLDCRRHLSMLAVLFGSIAEIGEQLRWHQNARLLQIECLQASEVCKAASDQSYASAQNIQRLIGDLLQGQAPDSSGAPVENLALANRPMLMQRMEQSLEETISPSLANAREFRKKKHDINHEAQLLALLAQMIRQEGYEYADDETYLEYTNQLRKNSRELRRACEQSNYEAARTAAGKISQSCSECHEGYRG